MAYATILVLSLFIIFLGLLCMLYSWWESQQFSSDGNPQNSIPTVFYYRGSEDIGSETEYAVINSQNSMAIDGCTGSESRLSTNGISSSRVLSAIDGDHV